MSRVRRGFGERWSPVNTGAAIFTVTCGKSRNRKKRWRGAASTAMKAARHDPSVPAGRVSISLMNVGSLCALRFSSCRHPFCISHLTSHHTTASPAPVDPPRRLTSSKWTSLAMPARLPHPSHPLSQPNCGQFDLKRLHLTHVSHCLLSLLPRNSPFELKPSSLPLFPPRPLIFPSLPPADCHHRAGITPVSSHTSRHTGETCAG